MAALLEAEHFLSPVLDRTQLLSTRNLSLLERLTLTLPTPPTPSTPAARAVLPHALHLLQSISATSTTTADLVSASSARTLNALMDLLVLEGIYPSLSPGVGVPLSRRARNFVLPPARSRRVVEVEDRRDVELLAEVVDGLVGVLAAAAAATAQGPAARTLRERCLVDVLAGCGELAFVHGGGSEVWAGKWRGVVDSTPTPSLLPALLSLLHPTTPPPFRTPLTRALSTLPMARPHAVRHILELFLSTVSDAALSLDALSNASRIIGAVPATVGPAEYFAKVCPQLLELLDGKDAGLARAAAYVLAELLGRKGAVEAVVEREVVAKIVAGMVPAAPEKEPEPVGPAGKLARKETSSTLLAFEDTPPPKPTARFSLIQEIPDDPTPATAEDTPGVITADKPLIPEPILSQTLTRLSTLLTAHPSPSVPQRLLAPLLQPLWALTIYALTTSRSTWHARALALLRTHVKTSSSPAAVLSELHTHLLSAAALGPGEEGGIEVRRGAPAEVPMDEVDVRVEAFVGLLGEAPEEAVAEFFLGLLRAWLGRGVVGEEEEEGREGAMRMLATMKVLREVLGRYEGALAKSPTQTLQIVGGVLGEYRLWKEAAMSRGGREEEEKGPSLGGLGKIVVDAPPPLRRERGGEEEEEDEDEDLDEETSRAQTVTLALSLLSVLVSSPDTKLTAADERLLQTLHPALTFLTTAPSIPADVSSFSLNILSLLTLHTPSSSSAPTSLHQQQKETHTLALSYLRDPLIPVRAHGLHLLRTLILASSPTIDVPATASLLIATLADTDSYVYLNAVKALTALSDRHARTVIKILIDAYVDAPEARSLDERLRLGEALLATVQRQGAALAGDAAETLGTAMVGVVSRRKTRGKQTGGEGEDWGEDEEEEEDADAGEDEDEAAREKRRRAAEYNAAIVSGWDGKGRTEDVRIRASALSVLGAAVEAGAAGLGARVLGDAVDVSVMVLTLEGGIQFAILRRAAVVCIGSVLRALVSQGGGGDDGDGGDEWRVAVWEVLRGRVKEVGRVLAYVAGTDNDGLVREQAGVVRGNLEAVMERWMLGGRSDRIVEVEGERRVGGFGAVRVL